MSAIRSWIAFVDGILDDLGASAPYRAERIADSEAMIGLGLLAHTPLEEFKSSLCCSDAGTEKKIGSQQP